MAIADIKQRPGVLLGAAILLHVVLISAQVNTKAGLPLLQVVTFGSFSEVQRGMMALVSGARGLWTGYVGLQNVQVERRASRARHEDRQAETAEAHARTPAAAARAARAARLVPRGRVIAARRARNPDRNIDKGRHRAADRHAVISAGGVRGVILPGGRRPRCSCGRRKARRRVSERTRAGRVIGSAMAAAHSVRARTSDVKTGDLVVTRASRVDQGIRTAPSITSTRRRQVTEITVRRRGLLAAGEVAGGAHAAGLAHAPEVACEKCGRDGASFVASRDAGHVAGLVIRGTGGADGVDRLSSTSR